MEYSLAAYGVSPEDASFFRLQDYAKHTLQYEVENGPVTKTKAVFDAVFVDDDGKNDRFVHIERLML